MRQTRSVVTASGPGAVDFAGIAFSAAANLGFFFRPLTRCCSLSPSFVASIRDRAHTKEKASLMYGTEENVSLILDHRPATARSMWLRGRLPKTTSVKTFFGQKTAGRDD